MNQLRLIYYKNVFVSVKLGKSSVKGLPNMAKPILILSVIDAVDSGLIVDNKIFFSSTLDQIYKNIFRDLLPLTSPTLMVYPYYYMKNEPFWSLQLSKENVVMPKTPHPGFIEENVSYAYLDDALWNLLQDKTAREELKQTILNFFFK